MTTKRDYYEILGINKNSTPEEIKKAYRKMALKYHPDRNKSADAEQKFKEINEAYQILSDPKKKQTYDQFGHSAFDPSSGFGSNPYSSGSQQGPFTWSYSSGSNPFENVDFGDPFEIFETFFGGGGFHRRRRKPRYSLHLGFKEAILGSEKTVEVEGKKKKIKIPAGVDDGTRIDFGEFEITFDVAKDPDFKREGLDLFLDYKLPLTTLLLGDTIKISTIDNEIKLKIRPLTKGHTLVRLKNEGVPSLRRRGYKGDLYVRLIADIPDKLNSKQKRQIEELKKLGL